MPSPRVSHPRADDGMSSEHSVSMPTDVAASVITQEVNFSSMVDELQQLYLATLTVDLDIETLTYPEADNIRVWNMAAVAGAEDCFFALHDIESSVEIKRKLQ
ncbi:Uncharacterized protein Fot_29298 [Forsythia ovata]|uniref:Uncharacterized protein n=1 Tax=Forsythia ovata TaxID=205694 RepID=A0ABD1TRJ9_9LAMI